MTITEFDSIIDDIEEKSFYLDFVLGYDEMEVIKVQDVINILDKLVNWGGY